jgi:hypothetical protein
MDEINNLLQSVSSELQQWEVQALLDQIEEDAYLEEYLLNMENLLSSYSYTEE